MKYVFDECVPERIAKALKELGKDCDSYSVHWERGTPDIEWIPKACVEGWCIITVDDLLKSPHQRTALREHSARVVVFPLGNLKFWDQVRLIINRWEEVEKATSRKVAPYVLKFTSHGSKPQELTI